MDIMPNRKQTTPSASDVAAHANYRQATQQILPWPGVAANAASPGTMSAVMGGDISCVVGYEDQTLVDFVGGSTVEGQMKLSGGDTQDDNASVHRGTDPVNAVIEQTHGEWTLPVHPAALFKSAVAALESLN